MSEGFITFISAIIGAIIGGFASYFASVRVQRKFLIKNIKLERMEATKEYVHEYTRTLALRDTLTLEHIKGILSDLEFEKRDGMLQETLRVMGKNLELNKIYLDKEIHSEFDAVKNQVGKEMCEYYHMRVDNKYDYKCVLLGDLFLEKLLNIIKKIDDCILKELNIN